MPFHIDEKFIQSDWNETNDIDPSFIRGKPALLKGEPGNDGQKGQKGEIGPRGIEGEKGTQGPDGSKGQKGEIGIGQKGEVGEKGIDGQKGQKGELGISITGEKGEPSLVKGQKGEIGIGQKGIDGEKGIDGAKGIQGEQGQKGQKGELGNIGITGQKGQKGELGIMGNTGQKGQKGEIGLTGDKGQKGEIHSSKFVNNGLLNSSDKIELIYDDGNTMSNKIDISSLRELPTMLNTYYGKRLTVVQPSSGSGVEAMWINQDTYSFTESRTTGQLEVQKVEQNTTSPYFNTTTTNTYNFLPVLVNDKVLSVTNGALNWVDFPADDNTRVSGFSIDASNNLSLSQNDGTTPYSVNLSPYLDNTDNYITSFALSNGLITGTMTGGQSNPTGQILPTNAVGFLTNDGQGNLTYGDDKLSNVVESFSVSTGNNLVSNGNLTNASVSMTNGVYELIDDNTSGAQISTGVLTNFNGVRETGHQQYSGIGWVSSGNSTYGSDDPTTSKPAEPNGMNAFTLRDAYMYTTVSNLTSGQTYTLTYTARSRGPITSSNAPIDQNELEVTVIQSNSNVLQTSTNLPYAWTNYSNTFVSTASTATLQFKALDYTNNRWGGNFVSNILVTGVAQQTIGEQLWNVSGNTLKVMRLEAGNNITFDTSTSYGVINISSATGLPTQTGQNDKFLKTDGTNASWTNKIGSATAHTFFHWTGGTPNHYLLNQATSAGSECGNIVFGNTNGTFYSSISGKVRDSTSGQIRGYIQINTQHGDSSANLDEEILRIGESSHSTSDAGEFFGNLKVTGIKYTNNSVQTLPLITPTSSDVGKFLAATSTGAFDWHNKIGSSTAYNWFYWSGGIINSYLLSQPSSAEDQCGAITFGHTNGTMYSTIYGKVRDTTAGQLRGYIQIDTQNNNGTDVLTEETLRIGESTHTTSDAGEFFGNLRVTGIKYSANNNIQTEAVEAPTAADATANRILKATGAGTWAWSDPSAIVVNTLQSGATQNGTEVYNAWYHDTVRGIDALAKLDKSEVKNTLQSGATLNGTEVYNCFYHDTVRGIDALAKLDKSHVQSVYQASPNDDDVYNCAHHDLAFKNTYGILYGNTQSSTYTTGYINQFYRESNNQKNITLVSSNTGQNDTLGSIQAWDGSNYLSSAIAFLLSDETTVSGRINFYSYTNNNHATAGPSVYIQDDIINVKDLEAIRSITQNSVLNTSNITNTCPANPKFISKSSTSTSTAVIGNFQTQALVNVTGNVQYPPALSANTSTVSGVTYTLTASTNAFTGSSYDMYKAFDRINNTGWHSHGNYNSSNNPNTMGLYQGTNSLGGVSGEWIQLEMSSAQPFGSVKIIGRQGYDTQAADDWEVLASNNGSSWTSILQSTVHVTYNNGNGHQVTINNTTSYTHYAIVAKSVKGPSSAYLTIHEIEFYTAVTTAYGEFTDLKTTKYGTDWGILDINIRQNASLTPLVRIGKTQSADPQDIMWNGKVQCTDTFTVSNLKIQGSGSNITFNNGLSQTQPLVDPTTINYNNKAVLTAGPTGTWNWDVPPFVTKNNYVEVSSLSLLPTSYDSNNPLRVWLDGAGSSTGSNISGVLRVGQVNTQYDPNTGRNNNVLQCANSNSSIFAFTHTSANRTQNNKHNLTISVNSNLEFVYLFDVKPSTRLLHNHRTA